MSETSVSIRLSRAFMTFSIYWASLNNEFSLPYTGWMTAIDRITIYWSFFILVTSSFKLVKSRPTRPIGTGEAKGGLQWIQVSCSQDDTWTWSAIIQLDYLPNLDVFKSVYYGLMMVTVGTAFVWRLLFNEPKHNGMGFLSRTTKISKKPTHELDSELIQENTTKPGAPFDGRLELIKFFLEGPSGECDRDSSSRLTDELIDRYFRQNCSHLLDDDDDHEDDDDDDEDDDDDDVDENEERYHGMHKREQHVTEENCCAIHEQRQQSLDEQLTGLRRRYCQRPEYSKLLSRAHGIHRSLGLKIQTYTVPIRSANFLLDNSKARWNTLARHVHGFVVLVTLVTITLTYLEFLGLVRMHQRFGPRPETTAPGAGCPPLSPAKEQYFAYLTTYGYLEEMYAVSQMGAFFMCCNIFLTLIHADLLGKVGPITSSLQAHSWLFMSEQIETLPLKRVYAYQVRIWAYFDQIKLFDRFVSRYALALLAQIVIALLFGQRFIWMDEMKLRRASLICVGCAVISLAYLHLMSEHVERRAKRIQKAIMIILARERNITARRQWQRVLKGFFLTGRVRTFTLVGEHPTNLRNFFRIATAALAACAFIHRVFYRRAFYESFGPVSNTAG